MTKVRSTFSFLRGVVVFHRMILGAAFAAICTAGASAGESDKWSAYVDAEGKLGTDRNLGEVSLFVPLGQSQTSLLFGNLISRIDDQDSFEGNVGLGYREIVDGSYILGGYAFYDRRRTKSDQYFNQLTFGAEFMTDVWTARANAYLADDKLVATGGGVVQQTGTQIFVQSNVEGALSGFDAEVGRVIPLGLQDVTWSGFAGGFHFERSGFDNVSGPRVRTELTFDNLWEGFLPSATQLRLGAEFQHDDVRNSQGFVSARLRIPLFGGNDRPRLSALDRRMVDPVVRDIDVVAGAGLSTPVAPVLQGGGSSIQGVVIIDGTDDLGVALSNAGPGSIVIINGTAGVVSSATNATVQPGQMVVGAQNAQFQFVDPNTGQAISWQAVPNGVRPTVSGVVLGLPADGSISGLDFSSSFVSSTGGGVFAGLSLDANISDSTFVGNPFTAMIALALPCSALSPTLSGLLTMTPGSISGLSLPQIVVLGANGSNTTLQNLTLLNQQITNAQVAAGQPACVP